MRYPRLLLRAQGNHFHVVSRIVGRAFFIGEREKGVFHGIMRRLEKYAGVQVLSYCLMDNHVHLLLRTEEIDGDAIGDGELIRRIGGMYSKGLARELEWQLDHWRKKESPKQIAYWRERYLDRLGNLSEFMRLLKNNFSKWFNAVNDRCGVLWEDRYKVVLVEESAAVLMKIAAYIDLNPVRAGLVRDPGKYRWSGYGEASGSGSWKGRKRAEARRGIGRIVAAIPGSGTASAKSSGSGPGSRSHPGSDAGSGQRQGQGQDSGQSLGWREAGRAYGRVLSIEADQRTEESGEMGLGELLLQSVRYFTDGVVIGSREFVDAVFASQPAKMKGKRKTGARKMKGGDWGLSEGLYALRDLTKNVIVKAWSRDT